MAELLPKIVYPRELGEQPLPAPARCRLPDGVDVKFGISLVGVEVRKARLEYEYDTLRMTVRVKDRDTGELIDVTFTDKLNPYEPLAAAVRRSMIDMVVHEIDESIRLNGVLVRDPHAVSSIEF